MGGLRTRASLLGGDRGDVVMGWLIKLAVVLSMVGVAGFDAVSIGSAKFSVEDTAVTAAAAGSDMWQRSHDADKSYAASVAAATEANPLNQVPAADWSVDRDGTVHLTMCRLAPTLVVRHVPPARDWPRMWSTVAVKSTV